MAWNLVAEVGEITPGNPKLVNVGSKEIGIFFEGDTYYAVLNYCPHFAAEICKGHVTGTLFSPGPCEYDMQHDALVLRCPWHHWEFSLDTGKAVIPSIKERLKTYPVKVEEGSIYIEA